MFDKLVKTSAAVAFVLMFAFTQAAYSAAKVITWEDLIPPSTGSKPVDFSKFQTNIGIPNVKEFGGNKEELTEYMNTMEFMKMAQPLDGDAIVTKLNGTKVKIAGYVTPITFDGDKVVDFLFVPYHGACIHVPPPPANQIVYVENAKGLKSETLYEPVWLVGTLTAKPVSTVVANVGYTIENATVEPYTE